MKSLRLMLVTLAVAVLGACAAVGIPPADTFNKKLAAGYVSVSAVADAAASAKASGVITAADAKGVLTSVQIAEQGLDAAAQLHASDPTGADTKLAATIAALTALQGYLDTKGAK